MSNKSRRNFIKQAGLAMGSFYIVPRHVLGKGFQAPSDRLNIMGIGGRQGLFRHHEFLQQRERKHRRGGGCG